MARSFRFPSDHFSMPNDRYGNDVNVLYESVSRKSRFQMVLNFLQEVKFLRKIYKTMFAADDYGVF